MNIIKYAKLSFLFLIFFVVFYFESLDVLGVKLAVAWKSILIFFILLYSFIKISKSGFRIPSLTFWGLIFSIQSIFNASLLTNPLNNFAESIKSTFIPAFYLAFVSRPGSDFAYKLMIVLATFSVISTIPFLLNIIDPISTGYDLTLFGFESQGFVGIFQNAHAASIVLGTAMLVLIYNLHNDNNSTPTKILIVLLLVFASASLYLTYARTGYFLFILGLLTYYLTNKKIRYKYIKLFLISLSIALLSLYLYQVSEIFRMRLFGENIYTELSGSSRADSGRMEFIITSIKYFMAQDLPTIIVGMGPEMSKELMDQEIGMRITAHNGFVNILQFNGLLGVFLYSVFLISMAVKVYSFRKSDYFPIVSALFVSYLAQMAVQGERVFLADVIFAASLAIPLYSSQIASAAGSKTISRDVK